MKNGIIIAFRNLKKGYLFLRSNMDSISLSHYFSLNNFPDKFAFSSIQGIYTSSAFIKIIPKDEIIQSFKYRNSNSVGSSIVCNLTSSLVNLSFISSSTNKNNIFLWQNAKNTF